MIYVLHGPPGIGKSSIITELKEIGYVAFDMEELPFEIRHDRHAVDSIIEALLTSLGTDTDIHYIFIGGADLDSDSRDWPNTVRILLTAKDDAYFERRQIRDAGKPSKANQTATPSDFDGTDYDLVINTTGESVDETVARISVMAGLMTKLRRLRDGEEDSF